MGTVAALFFMLAVCVFAGDSKEVSLEDKTKAVFMYHFTKYVEWPESDSSETFNIAVLGNSNIAVPLKEIEKKKQVNERKIKIVRLKDLPDTLDCHMLFISRDWKGQLPEILKKTKDGNILSISDTKGFGRKGVAINFIIVEGKIKFEINGSALDATELVVSSQLLKLGRFIKEKKRDD